MLYSSQPPTHASPITMKGVLHTGSDYRVDGPAETCFLKQQPRRADSLLLNDIMDTELGSTGDKMPTGALEHLPRPWGIGARSCLMTLWEGGGCAESS